MSLMALWKSVRLLPNGGRFGRGISMFFVSDLNWKPREVQLIVVYSKHRIASTGYLRIPKNYKCT
jgi:hypothetical protein